MRFIKNTIERKANKERRQFLDLIARAGVSTSLLKASPLVMGLFAARYSEAQGNNEKRVVFLYQPDGSPPGLWKPSGSTMNVATSAYGSGNAADGIVGYNVSEYCRFYELDNVFAGHGEIFKALGHNTYASAIGNTLDTQLAKSNGFTSNFSILRASAHRSEGEGGFSVENGGVSSFTEGAREVFDLAFNGASVVAGDNTYKRVFEMNAAALTSIKGKLGAEEISRMDEHLNALEKIETSLENASTDTPDDACEVRTIGANSDDIVEHGKTLADVIVAALKCGLTNVASIMLSDTQCGWGLSADAQQRMNISSGISVSDFHSANHGGTGDNHKMDQARMLAYISQVPAYLLSRLAVETDATGVPLIDSTLFVQFSEMGYGNNHSPSGTPWILASGAPMRSNFGSYGGNTALCKDIPGIAGLRGNTIGDIV